MTDRSINLQRVASAKKVQILLWIEQTLIANSNTSVKMLNDI